MEVVIKNIVENYFWLIVIIEVIIVGLIYINVSGHHYIIREKTKNLENKKTKFEDDKLYIESIKKEYKENGISEIIRDKNFIEARSKEKSVEIDLKDEAIAELLEKLDKYEKGEIMKVVKHKIKKEYMDLILSGEKLWEIRKFDSKKHTTEGRVNLELEVIETGEKHTFKAIITSSRFLSIWDMKLFFPYFDSIQEVITRLEECGINESSKVTYFQIEQ